METSQKFASRVRRKHVVQTMVCGVATAIAASSFALATPVNKGDASVRFTAIGPAGFKIVGTTSDLVFAVREEHYVVRVPLANLVTGIALRDRHMKEKYLEVNKFPDAELLVLRRDIQWPSEKATTGNAKGDLSLHGKTSKIPFSYTAQRKGEKSVRIEAKFEVDIRDFGISIPSYLGVTVKPVVALEVAFGTEDS